MELFNSSLPIWVPCFAVSCALYTGSLTAEYVVANRRGLKVFDRKEGCSNTLILVAFALCASFWTSGVAVPLFYKVQSLSPWKIGANWLTTGIRWWEYLLLFLLEDLCFYVYHRTMHRLKVGWALHEAHHSSPSFNITVAAREPVLAVFFSGIFWMPLAFIGFDPLLITTQQWLNFSFQLVIHTQLVGKLGPLEWFLNTPSHHRVHHGQNPQYVDKNFGGIFIIWDKLFGTFEPEREPVIYGVAAGATDGPPRYSPIGISINGLRALWENQRRRPSETPQPLSKV